MPSSAIIDGQNNLGPVIVKKSFKTYVESVRSKKHDHLPMINLNFNSFIEQEYQYTVKRYLEFMLEKVSNQIIYNKLNLNLQLNGHIRKLCFGPLCTIHYPNSVKYAQGHWN